VLPLWVPGSHLAVLLFIHPASHIANILDGLSFCVRSSQGHVRNDICCPQSNTTPTEYCRQASHDKQSGSSMKR